MEKNVLILGDFVGYGDVAMSTARGILTKLGFTAMCLPTALISNTFGLGAPAVLDTTDYLLHTLSAWDNLGIHPDAVLIGYLSGQPQTQLVSQLCAAWHASGIPLFLDPIFADNGKLYSGVDEARLDSLRALLPLVDYILPNATEACFLANTPTPQAALPALASLGAHNILVTGADGAVLLWDGAHETRLKYDPIPGSFGGAGDAFAALFAGHILSGASPQSAARTAIARTREFLLQSQPLHRGCVGLPVERFF